MMPSRKELLKMAMRHEPVPRVPWVPYAGVHAGRLIDAPAEKVLTDGDTLVNSLLAVDRIYKPDGLVIMFDLQLEAEILGCELRWLKDCPPSVSSHPLEDSMTVPCECTLPKPEDGRLPMVLSAMKRLKKEIGGEVALYGLICGPFTLASHLRGNNIFMDMYDDEEYVADLLAYCAACAKRMAGYYIDAGMDVVAVVDPLVSQISREHFEQFLTAPYTDIFSHIRSLGAFSSFFVCGDASRNIEPMCLTHPDSISVDENVNMVAAKEICDRYNVTLGGNIPLTTVMLHGTQQDNMKQVLDILDSIKDHRNLIVSPGCDMPYQVPVENTIGAAQAVFQPEEVREMLKNYTAVKEDIRVDLPDYGNLDRPLIEVFTLDSDTCAACTYMMGAARAAEERFGTGVDLVEYKYTIKENIARCIKMGVKNLPSLYINGQLKFSSIIPSPQELDEAIRSME